MPRAYWVQKNRYCWNSRLSEPVFLSLLKLYCSGYSCSDAARIVTRFAAIHEGGKISRQTANRYYLLFGDYLYALLPDQYKFANLELDEKAPPTGNEPEFYEAQIVLVGMHQVLYDKLDYKDEANKIFLANTTQEMHAFLQMLSRSRRGLPIKAFTGHVALCMWWLLIQSIKPELPPGKALFEFLQNAFEEKPIGTFELMNFRVSQTK